MTIVERLQRAIDDEPFMLGGEHDLLRDALNEIEIQRGIIERLRADLAIQQGCCDGAAAQDAHVRREREEHRAEVERLREENLKLRRTNESLVSRIGGMLIRANNENERLRAALRRIAAIDTYSRRTWIMAVQAAREALEDGR